MSHDSHQGKPDCKSVTGDNVDATAQRRVFDRDATSWLVGQAIRYLHAADEEEEIGLQRSVELLGKTQGATATIAQAFHDAPRDDHNLRWSLLYLLSELGDSAAAEVFYKFAAEAVTPRDRYPQGCETPREGEVLVRTMAIAGLARTASTNKDAVEMLYKLLEAQTDRALRIETVQALIAHDPNSVERVKSLLPKDLHFALEIKKVKADALAVEQEVLAADVTRFAPELGSKSTTPKSSNCNCC